MQDAPIPRRVLFGNPERTQPALSPDGKQLAWLAPKDDVLNVWVAPADDPAAARPVTSEARPVPSFSWTFSGRHLIVPRDADGDENWHLFAVDAEDGSARDLTPCGEVHAMIMGLSEDRPNELLIGLNDREPALHDVWLVDLESGERTLVEENPGLAGYVTDEAFRVRLAVTITPDGGQVVLRKDPASEVGWSALFGIDPEDALTTGPAGFDRAGDTLYAVDSRGRDTAALVSYTYGVDATELGEPTVLAEDPRADVHDLLADPDTGRVQAVGFVHLRKEWQVLDPTIEADLTFLRGVDQGDLEVLSRSSDDARWVVAFLRDDGPVRYYLFERAAQNARFLFQGRSDLDGLPLVPMQPLELRARDGLPLVSYLSLPPGQKGRPESPLPMVLCVHGGPWHRDTWGFHPVHQWLANRGYAVLSVNFRGSTGFGKGFINAGNGEWGGRMHEDLIDAVEWAVEQGIAAKDRVAIFGGSYGGYATLVGLTKTPDLFACGVDIVGPSSLVTLLENPPPYWMPQMPIMTTRLADPSTDEGRAWLLERSPLTHADQITRPLLVAQGANDPRVKRQESDQLVEALRTKGIPVTYVLYPDEGHGFARRENDLSFYAIAEAFLARHLGGRCEPIGTDFEGASVEVLEGASEVPGLDESANAT